MSAPRSRSPKYTRENAIKKLRDFFILVFDIETEKADAIVNMLVATAINLTLKQTRTPDLTTTSNLIPINITGLTEEQNEIVTKHMAFIQQQMAIIKLLSPAPKRTLLTTHEAKINEVNSISKMSLFKDKKRSLSTLEIAINDLYQCIHLNKEAWGKDLKAEIILNQLLEIAHTPGIKQIYIDKMQFPPKLEPPFVEFMKKQLKIIIEHAHVPDKTPKNRT